MAHGRIRRLVTRRRVRRAALCLVLGGVMTVAVAWGCAMFDTEQWSHPLGGDDPHLKQYHPNGWSSLIPMSVSGGVGFTKRSSIGYRALGPSGDSAEETGQFLILRLSIVEHRFGLPWRTMVYVEGRVSDANRWLPTPSANIGAPTPNIASSLKADFPSFAGGLPTPYWFPKRLQERTLPLRPVWSGFLYSMLVYGTLAWLVLFIPFSLRRRNRLRHGLCLHCKYPLGDFSICPECGNPTGRDA